LACALQAIREELSVQNPQLGTMCGNAGGLQANMGGAQARLNKLEK
jgi:hypothetical protein